MAATRCRSERSRRCAAAAEVALSGPRGLHRAVRDAAIHHAPPCASGAAGLSSGTKPPKAPSRAPFLAPMASVAARAAWRGGLHRAQNLAEYARVNPPSTPGDFDGILPGGAAGSVPKRALAAGARRGSAAAPALPARAQERWAPRCRSTADALPRAETESAIGGAPCRRDDPRVHSNMFASEPGYFAPNFLGLNSSGQRRSPPAQTLGRGRNTPGQGGGHGAITPGTTWAQPPPRRVSGASLSNLSPLPLANLLKPGMSTGDNGATLRGFDGLSASQSDQPWCPALRDRG